MTSKKKFFYGVCSVKTHFLILNLRTTYTFEMQIGLSVVNVLFNLGIPQCYNKKKKDYISLV